MIRDARIAETGGKNRKTGERYPPLHSKFFALKMPEPFEIKGKREKSLHSVRPVKDVIASRWKPDLIRWKPHHQQQTLCRQ